jgi:hypothetical protein
LINQSYFDNNNNNDTKKVPNIENDISPIIIVFIIAIGSVTARLN